MALQDFLTNVFLAPKRGFAPAPTPTLSSGQRAYLGAFGNATILPQVTVSESHSDQSIVTSHPVEAGAYAASISDHAYSLPSQVRVNIAWSKSPTLNLINLSSFRFNNVQTIYQQLLDLKNNRVLLDLYTGKKAYKNMLITSITTTTDQRTENALFLDIEFREILLAFTQEVTSGYPNSNFQGSSNPNNQGTNFIQQLTPAPTGALPPDMWVQ